MASTLQGGPGHAHQAANAALAPAQVDPAAWAAVDPDCASYLSGAASEFGSDIAGQRAIVVVPSLTFDTELLAKVPGVSHYEERLLVMLLLLRDPLVRLVFASSLPIRSEIVDYYLGLVPGCPAASTRPRLTMVSCNDASPKPLTAKLLAHQEACEAIRAAVSGVRAVGLVTNNTTELERQLAVALGVPLLGNPPELDDLGTKSGSRQAFREAGIQLPDGFEHLADIDAVVEALSQLKAAKPDLARAVVKLEHGFSGEGNAVFDYLDAGPADIAARLRAQLRFEAVGESLDSYAARFAAMGGIVEEYLPDITASPSGQAYIDPWGRVRPISTHDQVLGGADGQVFLGSTFPAHERYRGRVQHDTLEVGRVLAARGARGRFSVDFVESRGRLAAIEVNLRRGGTTHSMMALELATGGRLEADGVTFHTGRGRARGYYATDNLRSPAYLGLAPRAVIEAAAQAGLAYDADAERGCIFHLLGALPDTGKLGVTCIDADVPTARKTYRELVGAIDAAAVHEAAPQG